MTNGKTVITILLDTVWKAAMMKRKDTAIDMVMTGQNIKRIMISKGYTVKDIQTYLKLSSVQSIYHWFDGKGI